MARSGININEVDQAAAILRDGGLIAFPTETYYGLAVDPFNEEALQRLFRVKQRPEAKPVLVLVPGREDVGLMAEDIPEAAQSLMDRFWPGPLTMVFPAHRELSDILTGGTGTVGVRVSPHPVAQALLRAFGGPVTATSANRSGGGPASSEEEVRRIFGDDIDMVLPGGRTPGGKPSTLIRFAGDTAECVREGCIPFEEILRAV